MNKINTDQSELHALYSQSSTSTSFSLRGFCSKKLLLTRLLRERSHYFYDCKKVFFCQEEVNASRFQRLTRWAEWFLWGQFSSVWFTPLPVTARMDSPIIFVKKKKKKCVYCVNVRSEISFFLPTINWTDERGKAVGGFWIKHPPAELKPSQRPPFSASHISDFHNYWSRKYKTARRLLLLCKCKES